MIAKAEIGCFNKIPYKMQVIFVISNRPVKQKNTIMAF
jgi:hypothetical protein